MAWYDSLLGRTPPSDKRKEEIKRRLTKQYARALAGGRLTSNRPNDSASSIISIEPPPDPHSSWRTLNLDSQTLTSYSPEKLIGMMADLSPEISSGIWNFLRLCNPGYELEVNKIGTDDPDDAARAKLDEFIESIPGIYKPPMITPLNVIINSLFMGCFVRGAALSELVLNEQGNAPENLIAPDPGVVRFRKDKSSYEMGQPKGTDWVSYDRETILYTPIDPLPGSPYGRAIITPAFHTSLFLISLLNDLKRVIMQQGYPRLDITVDFKALEEMSEGLDFGSQEYEDWVDSIMDEVATAYASLEPDDAYVHSDMITVGNPVGVINASVISGVQGLIEALERMSSRAMKLMPLLLGIDKATTDANANRQWEIQAAAIKAIQHVVEDMLSRQFITALNCQGIQASVKIKFAELRASEMLRDAQTEAMIIRNAQAKYLAGWITHEAASLMVTGAEPAAAGPLVINVVGGEDLISPDLFGTGLIQQEEALGTENTRGLALAGANPNLINRELLNEVYKSRKALERALLNGH